MRPLSFSRREKQKPISQINVVPYIDVMLVLLIIFMITTPLLTQGVQVTLPRANARTLSADNTDPIIVSVDQSGQLYLNISEQPDHPLAPQQLALRVAAQIKIDRTRGQKPVILVKGDRQAHYDDIVQAMALLQQAGIENVGLMTDLNTKAKTHLS